MGSRKVGATGDDASEKGAKMLSMDEAMRLSRKLKRGKPHRRVPMTATAVSE